MAPFIKGAQMNLWRIYLVSIMREMTKKKTWRSNYVASVNA